MIAPIETVWHVISIIIIITTSLILLFSLAKNNNTKKKMVLGLYAWHTFFSLIYMYFSLVSGADSIDYYQAALQSNIEFDFGTKFIVYFSHIFVFYFSLSYMGLFMIFNFFGSVGLLLFYASLKSITIYSSKKIKRLAFVIAFLPSVSFWSSAIGKDSISFLAINLALWSTLNLDKRKLLMALSIILLLLVRPHMAGMIVIALSISIFIGSKNIGVTKKIFISFLILPVAFVLIPFAGKYAGVNDVTNIAEVSSYIEGRQGANMGGGSSLDITNMSPPVKAFTFLFRPLPYEAHSIISLLSSLDNLILLGLFIYGIRFIRTKQQGISNHTFLWLYVIISTFLLSSMTANLGIAVRQKWMIMPMLIYLLFAGIDAYQLKKRKNKLQ
jgi:hypothetical protein